MTDYCDTTDVASYLQRPLTTEEQEQAYALITAASEWIDAYTGTSYGPAVITGEQHTIYGPYLFLRRTPVASIQAATLRSPTVGAGVAPSLVSINYELLDPSTGRVTIGAQLDFARDAQIVSYGGYVMSFDYTVVATVPARVKLAAAILTADWLRTPDVDDYDSASAGGVSVSRRKGGELISPRVLALLPRKLVFA